MELLRREQTQFIHNKKDSLHVQKEVLCARLSIVEKITGVL